MSEEKINEIYEELLQDLEVVIKRDFRSCNLEKQLRSVLYNLASEAVKKKWSGWKIIVKSVFKTVGQARSLAERYNKGFCNYLDTALKDGWIENWVHGFRQMK